MKTLSFVTSSSGKFKEVQSFLATKGINIKQIKIDLEEIQEVDSKVVIEHKVKEAKKKGYRNFLIEDSSLTIHGLGKLPGALTKWFQKELGNDGTYLLATRVGKSAAVALTIFAYCDSKGSVQFFSGQTKGTIVSPRGDNGFGWDRIFRPDGGFETFSEMDLSEKAAFSMRVKALKKFLAAFKPGN